jgi:Na+-translocating ferredoxin:NAD+ oxidoreductase subunit D
MNTQQHTAQSPEAPQGLQRLPALEAPFLRAPEGARTIFLVTLAAICVPLAAGLVLFGWRAAIVTGLSIGSCVFFERLFFHVHRTPALLGRSHGVLTGALLAATLPPFVPWYIPVVAAAAAIVVGKAIFGGVGHFLWQPALVGRLAVAVMFPLTLATPVDKYPDAWPILTRDRLVTGNLQRARPPTEPGAWKDRRAGGRAHAMLVRRPASVLAGLTGPEPAFSGLARANPDVPGARPALLPSLPPMEEMLIGTHPGGIGETCAILILIAGLYLVYRNYVKWQLPASFLLAAGAVAAVAPVQFVGTGGTAHTVWLPFVAEGFDVGFTYVNYQLLSGGMLLAAMFLAGEMTTRPVTTRGQIVFGLACGALAMALRLGMLTRLFGLTVQTPIPAYIAVLAMNTLTPWIETICRPRVLGQKRFRLLSRKPG